MTYQHGVLNRFQVQSAVRPGELTAQMANSFPDADHDHDIECCEDDLGGSSVGGLMDALI